MPPATVIRSESIQAPVPSPFIAGTQVPEPVTFVIFGATGDLAARKLLPALFGLWKARFLPEHFVVVGLGRRDKTDDDFRQDVQKALAESRKDWPPSGDGREDFLSHVSYHRADFNEPQGLKGLAGRLQGLEQEWKLPGNRLFYLATDPDAFGTIVAGLADAGLVHRDVEKPWARVVPNRPAAPPEKSP